MPGYGGHPIRPHCSLTGASDSGVILIPPIFNEHRAPLAVQAAMAQAQTGADHGEAAALKHSVPDIMRLLNSRDAAEAMHPMVEGRPPALSGL